MNGPNSVKGDAAEAERPQPAEFVLLAGLQSYESVIEVQTLLLDQPLLADSSCLYTAQRQVIC